MKRETLIKKYSHILDETITENIKHKVGRKNKFNNFVYLNYIFRVFFYGESWINLELKHDIDRSTIRKKFYLLVIKVYLKKHLKECLFYIQKIEHLNNYLLTLHVFKI